MAALARKLQSLGYHSPNSVDLKDEDQLKALVVWLEDQKIRNYKIEDRAPLRDNVGKEWMDAFWLYLKDLECPFADKPAVLSACEWLVGFAVKYDFEEECERRPELKAGIKQDSTGLSNTLGQSTSDPSRFSIDPGDEDLKKGCSMLARLLHITPHPDVGVMLEAILVLVEERLAVVHHHEGTTEQVSSSAKGGDKPSTEMKEPSTRKQKKGDIEITAKDCGFNLADPTLAEAAKALRVLHVRELRTLQTQINELIVTVQAMTANPKADHALGKVGK